MNFKYFIREHVGKGMTMQTLQGGILKLNHLLSDELFKWKRHAQIEGGRKSHHLEVLLEKEMCCCQVVLRLQEGRDVDQP